MKSLFRLSPVVSSVALALGLCCASQSANAFYVQAAVTVNYGMVTAEVCNEGYGSAMVCRTQANGVTNTGTPLYAWTNMVIYPGSCEYAYVYATAPYYFINGSGFANCDISSY